MARKPWTVRQEPRARLAQVNPQTAPWAPPRAEAQRRAGELPLAAVPLQVEVHLRAAAPRATEARRPLNKHCNSAAAFLTAHCIAYFSFPRAFASVQVLAALNPGLCSRHGPGQPILSSRPCLRANAGSGTQQAEPLRENNVMRHNDPLTLPAAVHPRAADDLPRIVIIGAGFAGLACAKALGGAEAHVTIIDRQNYHLFVPLLYQVATAALSPADVAEPVRRILRKHKNIHVMLGTVAHIDRGLRTVALADGQRVPFDILVVAPGSSFNYFGHSEWEQHAPGVKSVHDARMLRSRLLSAFELAEQEPDLQRQQDLMTTVVVGGGPTGVEMAGAIAELARCTLVRDFRRIDPATARILLVEAGPDILGAFPQKLRQYAGMRLQRLGVEVKCNSAVESIESGCVRVAGETIAAGTVVWGAGVKAAQVGKWLGQPTDRMGRVEVGSDLAVPGLKNIYVLGDSASFVNPSTGKPLPGLAQVAQQQGRHLGRALKRHLRDGTPLPAFSFHDRGNTAIIGRNAAIFDFGKWQLKGFPAWLLWALVHVYLLVGFERRTLVSLQWLWRYITFESGARLITNDPEYPLDEPDGRRLPAARDQTPQPPERAPPPRPSNQSRS